MYGWHAQSCFSSDLKANLSICIGHGRWLKVGEKKKNGRHQRSANVKVKKRKMKKGADCHCLSQYCLFNPLKQVTIMLLPQVRLVRLLQSHHALTLTLILACFSTLLSSILICLYALNDCLSQLIGYLYPHFKTHCIQ